MITIFTDGAAIGNPGPGGYGVILRYGDKEKEFSGGYQFTTNNRMELMAVIVGLEAIKTSPWEVVIVSDSRYVVDAVSKGWLRRWKKKGFKKKKNRDLWERYLRVADKHDVTFRWVKGHAGHSENERCDQLAVAASMKDDLPKDHVFEETMNIYDLN